MLNTGKLKKFASKAREDLIDQVRNKLVHVLNTDSAELREKEKILLELKKQIKKTSKDAVIEIVAYTWFNRFCALRFMDINRYSRMGIVSPAEGATQPEILAEAKQGHIDERILEGDKAQHIFKLLGGTISSKNPQAEAYRLLIVAACNYYHRAMPYLFERIEDYTELLMPNDLLSDNSILADVRDAIGMDDCQDVEIIGWLYQYYISNKKDTIFQALKQNKKNICVDDIPAATQLFTPHWIVCYLVENSLGRLWLLNNPNSNLKSKMEYYIEPEEKETDFLKISSPEEIKICDPACGSGHMLTYAFDLLYVIYEEQGYDETEIPELILKNNLYGIEIDERARELAAFALSMKARDKDKSFFKKNIQPHICVLEKINFTDIELSNCREKLGQEDLFSLPLLQTLEQFAEVDNFGSLIKPKIENPLPKIKTISFLLKEFKGRYFKNNLLLNPILQEINKALTQAEYLKQKYHVVIANPPYMGGKNMNPRLRAWLKDNYADAKSDLFSAFVIRNAKLALPKGQLGFMTPFVWMFISSYKKLRNFLIDSKTITSLIQLEYSGFDGATVPICTFTFENTQRPDFKGGYIRLSDFRGAKNQAIKALEAIQNKNCGWFYRASSADFKKIPGNPIAYWVSKSFKNIFSKSSSFSEHMSGIQGIITGKNSLFLRLWYEVCDKKRVSPPNIYTADNPQRYWISYAKGGEYRKWYGNNEFVLNWKKEGHDLTRRRSENSDLYFKPCLSCNKISSKTFTARYLPSGFVWDVAGSSVFPDTKNINEISGLLCSNVAQYILSSLSPTLNFEMETILAFPLIKSKYKEKLAKNIINFSKKDWDAYETSWDFQTLPLLDNTHLATRLEDTYQSLRASWKKMTDEMKWLEEENNKIFINAYGLQDELSPHVPIKDITLTCNPYYRYGGKNTPEELEAKMLSDTMQEFIHYAVGCMFGRYSIYKPGLILANQGDTIAEYNAQIPNRCFKPKNDNVIPILDENWFKDDIVSLFQKFLRVTFGEKYFKKNLDFIQNAIGKKIRKYFIRDFYNYHVKRFKKRPIYWMFSSPKGTFNALIYMHRYRPDTISIVLNDYLRDLYNKLEAKKIYCEQMENRTNISNAEKNLAEKESNKIKMMLDELNQWEKKVLRPLATIPHVEIDLDDGVKVNYQKFEKALKIIKGLNDK